MTKNNFVTFVLTKFYLGRIGVFMPMLRKLLLILTLFLISPITTYVCGLESGMIEIPASKIRVNNSKKMIYLEKFYIDKTEVTQKNL